MKKIIVLIIVMCTYHVANSQSKYANPTTMFDIAGGSVNVNFGFCLGTPTFVQTLLLVGATNHSRSQYLTASLGWRITSNRFLFVPMFTYSGNNYQDLSFRFGCSIDRDRKYFINLISSTQRGVGMGLNFYFR